ncbi:hypothetical protein [Pseudoalteromonas sp. MMG012]|uniref:hypothetical protein n=1 Tax=Pseudoalteromonas sp. MMG012 TaxID=2822686 RepID=UPI001B3A3BC7|nr:hypothetical protein [Pseudoalteromonas sp. MMG012]MBQ4852023.1 hypothetical protein [Pseudoalteromonas sp. MMG012]
MWFRHLVTCCCALDLVDGVTVMLCHSLGAVDLSDSFLQQFDWILYKAEAA